MNGQMGYLIRMVEKKTRCNFLHYLLKICRWVARFVMAAELQGIILGFDLAYLIKTMVEEIFRNEMTIKAMIDRKIVFNIVEIDAKATERQL